MLTLSGIYKIESISLGSCLYVGSSIDISARFKQHKFRLDYGIGSKKLQAHVNIYGLEDLKFSMVEGVVEKYLTEMEILYYKDLQPSCNGVVPCKRKGCADPMYLRDDITFLDKLRYNLMKNRRINYDYKF